jgi:hypothetical protein
LAPGELPAHVSAAIMQRGCGVESSYQELTYSISISRQPCPKSGKIVAELVAGRP